MRPVRAAGLFSYGLLIFYLSSLSQESIPAPYLFIHQDKVMHASDDLHQSFVPGRNAGLGDWAADAVGILISSSIYYFKKLK
ncbi:MAG: VanZ family protein [Methanosarcinales archaeon]|nr:VanZ family protein [Methanosarcinales archaeon]